MKVLLCAFACLLIAACQRGQDEGRGNGPRPIVAFVAASTRDAVQEIAVNFTRDTKIEVRISADDSSRLAMQIVEGAPAQVFLSANEKWADFVKDKGLVQEEKELLCNSLVMVVPKGKSAPINKAEGLRNLLSKRLAVAGPTVPAGIYARQALKTLELWDALEKSKRIISTENVRVALAYVERGEADAGIVYATDARISDRVEEVYTFDPNTHDPIRYPLVLLKADPPSEAGRAFFEFLQTPASKDIFAKHGFSLLNGN